MSDNAGEKRRKKTETDDGRFDRDGALPKLMKALLCIPHSNASSERVFSMVRKIVTENDVRPQNCLCSTLM